jgi:hypothetical protein
LISADGRLLSPLFIVKESGGKFGPRVENTLFKAGNIYALASKSGKLTSDHFKIWLQNVYLPNVGDNSVLLLDSWSGHCPAVVRDNINSNKNVEIKTIPPGTTGQIQPLDVYGFRTWKNFIRHFSDMILLMEPDLILHQRNNILKLQSLVHNQLSSPRFKNFFKYSWFKSCYLNERPNAFENPTDYCFKKYEMARCEICGDVAIITCAWCEKSLCLKHFFHEYHYCDTYIE